MHGFLSLFSSSGNSRPGPGLWRDLIVAAVLVIIAIPLVVSYRAPILESLEWVRTVHGKTSAAQYADFGSHIPAPDARQLADWIADAGDNADSVFFVVDKRDARLYAFDRDARLLASTPILVGAARGDDSVPGIGTRPIALIEVHERTTPAGRFIAERGRNLKGEDVVWVDYDAAISMHRLRSADPRERRSERLATPDVADNRISYGCINVPAEFYDAHVRPRFATATALVYVLPEVKSLHQVFGSYAVEPRTATVNYSVEEGVRTVMDMAEHARIDKVRRIRQRP